MEELFGDIIKQVFEEILLPMILEVKDEVAMPADLQNLHSLRSENDALQNYMSKEKSNLMESHDNMERIAEMPTVNVEHEKLEQIIKYQAEIIQQKSDIIQQQSDIIRQLNEVTVKSNSVSKVQEELANSRLKNNDSKHHDNSTSGKQKRKVHETDDDGKHTNVKKAKGEVKRNAIEELKKVLRSQTPVMPEKYEEMEAVKRWREEAQKEFDAASENGFCKFGGTATVICLDASESMKEGNAWEEAMLFCTGYLNGIKSLYDIGVKEDSIGLVTFGHEVKVQMRLSKDIEAMKKLIKTLKPQGPSPLFAGMVLSEAVLKSLSKPCVLMNYLLVRPHIVLITDGKPTELDRLTGEDVHNADPEKFKETTDIICEEAARLCTAYKDLHCVVVGQGGRDFLNKLQKSSNVQKLKTYKDGNSMALYNTHRVAQEGDQKFVKSGEIRCISTKPQTIPLLNNKLINQYEESQETRFPTVGTRVRRGADWCWENQDGDGVGTIIGHNEGLSDRNQAYVYVEWDKDEYRNTCRVDSGPGSSTDLEYVYEDRIPPKGETLAVGSSVVPGKDFHENKEVSRGVVIKLIGSTQAEVRWDDASRGQYRFGKWGQAEEIKPLSKIVVEDSGQEIILEDKHLTGIAKLIPSSWQRLGTELGFTNAEMTHLESTYKISTDQQVHQMLLKWRQRAKKPSLSILLDAITKCGIDVDRSLLNDAENMIRDQYKNSINIGK